MDEIKTYTVASIIGSYPAQFDKTRVVFTTNETGAQQLSGFFKFPPQVGKTVSGILTITEKDGKTYHNFTPKAGGSRPMGSTGGMNNEQYQKLYSEIVAARQAIVMVRQLLEDKGLIPSRPTLAKGVEYPESTGKTAFEEPQGEEDPDGDPWAGLPAK